MTNWCSVCGGSSWDSLEPCPNCGREPEPQESKPPEEPKPPEPLEEPEPPEPPLAPVLRLLPQSVANAETKRAQCRRVLLEALQRLEESGFEELVLITINSKGPNPYTLRWYFTDPMRVVGVLDFGRQHILANFVRME